MESCMHLRNLTANHDAETILLNADGCNVNHAPARAALWSTAKPPRRVL